jgi:hypothetical protein
MYHLDMSIPIVLPSEMFSQRRQNMILAVIIRAMVSWCCFLLVVVEDVALQVFEKLECPATWTMWTAVFVNGR